MTVLVLFAASARTRIIPSHFLFNPHRCHLLLLLALGLILSRLALEASRRTASVGGGESVGLGGAVRKTYQAVLWLSCVYYYASLPLVLAIVLAVAGGIIYGFFAIGRIPIKIVAIVVPA